MEEEGELLSIFGAEVIGTALLILLGDGVVAAVLLNHSKAQNGGWIVITWGWGDGRDGRPSSRSASSAARISTRRSRSGSPSRARTEWSDVPEYLAGEFVGAFIGATLVWLAYLDHWRETEDPGLKLAVLQHRARRSATRLQHHHRGHRDVRAGLRRPGVLRRRGDGGHGTRAACSSACWCSGSASRSAGRRATRSTRRATSGRGSCTRSCRSPARAAPTGATPGSRSWGR